ncbi:MAG TPA: hemolysin family protein [Chakrabartia sp.]|jgi:putative hemolysin|nr:hemolysin family protein [Chakrabartia sp.]
MSPFPWSDVAIILALIALNGLFAMSELAIVSARKPRLEAMVRKGSKGAAMAQALAADPGRFLSAVQVGITLIGIIAGAYSGASLGGPMAERLEALGMRRDWADESGFAIVIGLTTFLSLIIGELVPKQFALRSPESIAAATAPPMKAMSVATAPLVWLLDRTSAAIFSLLGLSRESESQMTAEELHLLVAEASKSGTIAEGERQIISSVVRLADRPVREVMTPRTEIDWIDLNAKPTEVRALLRDSAHSRLLVANGSIDEIVGVVQARDVMTALLRREPLNLNTLLRKLPLIHDVVDAMDALTTFRASDVPIALVIDEYGHFEGIVTPTDLLSAIAGDFASDRDDEDGDALVPQDDGSLLVAGWATADQLAERLGLTLPEERDYATVAGLALDQLRHLPEAGESFILQGYRFEIVDVDGRKIDRLRISEVEDDAA